MHQRAIGSQNHAMVFRCKARSIATRKGGACAAGWFVFMAVGEGFIWVPGVTVITAFAPRLKKA